MYATIVPMFPYLKTLVKLALGRGVQKSYSQFGEDSIVLSLLKKEKGVYVDVGAYHPTLYSNTYALYRRGWHGLTIDPNKSMVALQKLVRPRDTSVVAAIGESGTGTYYRYSDGAFNTFDKAEADTRTRNTYLNLLGRDIVPFHPLRDILKDQKITSIDFLTIDVEGKDLEVLQSHDWAIPTTVIAVEDETFVADTPDASATYRYLKEKGYVLVGLSGLTLTWKKAGK